MANPTLAEYKAGVQAKGYGTDTAAAQVIAINSVRRDLFSLRRWRFLEKTTTVLATIGNPTVSLAAITDLGQVDAVRAEIGTEYDQLDYKTPLELRERSHLDRTVAIPRFWTAFAGGIQLYPWPQSAYTLTVDYIVAPVDLAADGDVDVIPRAFMDVVIWGAVLEFAYRERDIYNHSVAEAQFDRRLKDMIATDSLTQRQTAQRVGHWSGWDQY